MYAVQYLLGGERCIVGVIYITTYATNVTRACVTHRGLVGKTGTLNRAVGIRARKAVNARGRLRTTSVSTTSIIVLTMSIGVGKRRHFAGGHVIQMGARVIVGSPIRFLRGIRGSLKGG